MVEHPVDEDGYLMPSPRSPLTHVATPNSLKNNHHPYMDLLSDNKGSANTNNQQTQFPYPPPGYFLTGILMNINWLIRGFEINKFSDWDVEEFSKECFVRGLKLNFNTVLLNKTYLSSNQKS